MGLAGGKRRERWRWIAHLYFSGCLLISLSPPSPSWYPYRLCITRQRPRLAGNGKSNSSGSIQGVCPRRRGSKKNHSTVTYRWPSSHQQTMIMTRTLVTTNDEQEQNYNIRAIIWSLFLLAESESSLCWDGMGRWAGRRGSRLLWGLFLFCLSKEHIWKPPLKHFSSFWGISTMRKISINCYSTYSLVSWRGR